MWAKHTAGYAMASPAGCLDGHRQHLVAGGELGGVVEGVHGGGVRKVVLQVGDGALHRTESHIRPTIATSM